MHIFLSHSSKDAEEARRVCELLEQNDIPCFIAPRDIRLGKEYAEEIVDGIDQAAAVILLLSEEANKSPHVLREVERAVSRSIPILVYKLEEVTLSKSMEYFLMTHQWMNAQSSIDELSWFDEAGISKLAVPTQAAVEQDQSYWYTLDRDTYGVKEYCWWLREPVEGTASKCYLVGNGYTQDNIQQENVGLEGFGIRPALTVDLNAAVFEKD